MAAGSGLARAVASSSQHCPQCKGVWLDKQSIQAIAPMLSGVPEQRLEIEALGHWGGGIPHCPGCLAQPYEFVFVDLHIDYCTNCGGIWLDGSEANECIAGSGAQGRTRRKKGTHYRSAPRAAHPPCCRCNAHVELQRLYVTETGLVCHACMYSPAVQSRNQAAGEPAAVDSASLFYFLGKIVFDP